MEHLSGSPQQIETVEPQQQPSGTLTIDFSKLSPDTAKKLVRVLNGPSTTRRHKYKLKAEVDLETHQIKKMLELAEGSEQYAFIGFQACGLRLGEVLGGGEQIPLDRRLPGLRVEDMLQSKQAFVVHGKGFTYIDYDQTVKVNPAKIIEYPIPSKLFKTALELVDEAGDGSIFRTITRRTGHNLLKHLAKEAGVDQAKLAHNHRLRHWFEEACRPLVRDNFELADMMRHDKKSPQVSVGTTGSYARTLKFERRWEIILQGTKILFG
jgi:integrase